MSKVMVTEQYLTDIAGAIRGKLGVETQYTPGQMAGAIRSIPTGGGGDGSFYYDNYNGTMGVGYNADTGTAKIYFNGLDKTAADVSPASVLPLGAIGSFIVDGLHYTKAYGSDKVTQIGWIGFYSGKIRSWTIDTSQTLAGTFWGVLNLNDDAQAQNNPYEQPPV